MGKLIFALPISIWWLVAAWPVLLLSIAALYRHEWASMSRRAASLLFLLRGSVASLLLLCLAQPVWEKQFRNEIPLAVPILIDNSTSMWYPDPHRSPAEKVELAERLELFDPELRFRFSEFLRRELPKAQKALERVGEEELEFDEEPTPEQTAAFRKRSRAFLGLAERFENMASRLESPRGNFALLEKSVKESATEAIRAVVERAAAAERQRRNLGRGVSDVAKQYERLAAEISRGRKEAAEFLDALPLYQGRADEELSRSENPQIREAIETVSDKTRMALFLRTLCDIQEPLLGRLEEKNEKSPIHAFGERKALEDEKQLSAKVLADFRVPRTDLPGELTRLFSRLGAEEEVRQLVLVSDGRDNSGAAENDIVEILRKKQLRVIALAVGSTEPIPDAGVLEVEMPSQAFDGDKIEVKTKLKLVGRQDRPVKVRVLSGDKVLAAKVVPLDIKKDELGRFDLGIEFKVSGEERPDLVEIVSNDNIPENDARPVEIRIRKERIQALFIDEFPRWESRYLNLMLRRDKRMDLEKMRSIFLASQKNQKLGRGDRSRDFPPDRKSLFDFDLVVIGDVPPETFSRDEMENLASFVRDRGGSVIFLAGSNFMPGAYYGTPLQDLLPVHRAASVPVMKAGISMALTPEGREADFVQPYRGPTSPAGHGRLHWYRNDSEGAPTASVLAEDETTGRPLVVSSFYGAGKVLYLGSDELWRWRYRSGWKYHHEFWSLVLLWATSEKIEGESRYAKLHLDKTRFSATESPELKLKLVGRDGKPLEGSQGFVRLEGKTKSGDEVDTNLPYEVVDIGGLYRCELGKLPTGEYAVMPVVNELEGEKLEAVLHFEVIEQSSLENVYIRQNRPFLERLCEETGGQYFDFRDFAQLPDAVTTDKKIVERVEQTELWDTWWMLLAVTSLLVCEWLLRKRLNLV